MTPLCSSVALIRHPEKLEQLWLAYWNEDRHHLDFVTAEKLEGDSFRECIDREVAWLLNLRRGKDFIISSVARLHLQLPCKVEGQDTIQTVEFFVGDVYGKAGRKAVENNEHLYWLNSTEVLSGRTTNNLPVNPATVELLHKADVIARHAG